MRRQTEGFGAVMVVLAIGVCLGFIWGMVMFSQDIPSCQEDEVLYPTTNGQLTFPEGDLTCVHMEMFE